MEVRRRLDPFWLFFALGLAVTLFAMGACLWTTIIG